MPQPARGLRLPKRIALLHRPKVDASLGLAKEIEAHLIALGLKPEVVSTEDPSLKSRLPEMDMVVALGGDGTVLRAGIMCAPGSVPVLGLNLGRLGFLTEVQPGEWKGVLARILVGDYWLEERMMLRTEHKRDGQVLDTFDVLNETVVSRGALARPIRLQTMIDDDELTTYVADGLIIATATGSTAYALAVGGPILPPDLKNILIVPIAPHLCIERAIVLSHGATLEIIARTDHEAILSGDGQIAITLIDGDHIVVRTSPHVSRFVRVQDRVYFYRQLNARMGQNPAAGMAK